MKSKIILTMSVCLFGSVFADDEPEVKQSLTCYESTFVARSTIKDKFKAISVKKIGEKFKVSSYEIPKEKELNQWNLNEMKEEEIPGSWNCSMQTGEYQLFSCISGGGGEAHSVQARLNMVYTVDATTGNLVLNKHTSVHILGTKPDSLDLKAAQCIKGNIPVWLLAGMSGDQF